MDRFQYDNWQKTKNRPGRAQHGPVGAQHRLVDEFLLRRELAVGGKGAGDVRGVAVVLAAHVEQAELAQPLVVGRGRVAVVQDGRVGATGADARVAHVAHAAPSVAEVAEDGLHLELVSARSYLSHDLGLRKVAFRIVCFELFWTEQFIVEMKSV